MTVNTTTSRADYTGNGVTTAFTVPFYFLDNTHLTVLRTVIATGVSTTLVLGTDYTVTGAGVPAGGTVTCTVAPTAAQKISILRNVPFTQLTDYVPNDPFPAESHERALDQLTMLAQQVTENVSRAITLPAATTGISTNLPTAQPLQLLGFNAAGNALTTYDPTSLLTAAGSSGFSTQTFNGTGAQTAFTLSTSPGAIANLEVFISGVRQRPTTDYTLSGSTLTFVSGAPAVGTGNIFVRWGTTLGIGVPSDTSVTTTKIADANVTTAKIADANVTTAKIADGAVTTAKIANSAVSNTLLADMAANTVKVRAAASSGVASDLALSASQVVGRGATGDVRAVNFSEIASNKIVQYFYVEYTTYTSSATQIPFDDTIPQITEGVEIMTQAITPLSSTNRIAVLSVCQLNGSSGGRPCAAIFRDSAANALAVGGSGSNTVYVQNTSVSHDEVAGSTSARTYRVRVGESEGTIYVNGNSGGRIYGGASKCTLIVYEYTP